MIKCIWCSIERQAWSFSAFCQGPYFMDASSMIFLCFEHLSRSVPYIHNINSYSVYPWLKLQARFWLYHSLFVFQNQFLSQVKIFKHYQKEAKTLKCHHNHTIDRRMLIFSLNSFSWPLFSLIVATYICVYCYILIYSQIHKYTMLNLYNVTSLYKFFQGWPFSCISNWCASFDILTILRILVKRLRKYVYLFMSVYVHVNTNVGGG